MNPLYIYSWPKAKNIEVKIGEAETLNGAGLRPL